MSALFGSLNYPTSSSSRQQSRASSAAFAYPSQRAHSSTRSSPFYEAPRLSMNQHMPTRSHTPSSAVRAFAEATPQNPMNRMSYNNNISPPDYSPAQPAASSRYSSVSQYTVQQASVSPPRDSSMWRRFDSDDYRQPPATPMLSLIRQPRDTPAVPLTRASTSGIPQSSSATLSAAVSRPPSASPTSYVPSATTVRAPQPCTRPFGLPNVGNTCYMNAVLQCLLAQGHFVQAITSATSSTYGSSPVCDTFGAMKRGADDAFRRGGLPPANITNLLTTLKNLLGKRNAEFAGYEQADAHELLRTCLHAMHEEINKRKRQPYEELKDIPNEHPDETARRWLEYHRRRDDSVVYDRFGGVMRAVTRCDRCGAESLAFDPFLDVSLAFPRNMLRSDTIPLTDLFQNLQDRETIDVSQQWKCSRCRHQSSAVRHQSIYSYPRTLVWHLKRFNSRGIKTESQVLFPDKLRFANGGLYSLCGVVCHSGTSQMGHYTSYVKSGGCWFYCNDSSVSEATPSDVINVPTAYILFYESML